MKKILGGIVVVLCLIGVWTFAYTSSERNVTATVSDKERVCAPDGTECVYLVFTDKGTFAVKDTILYTRFDTSDVYGRIQADKTYDMRVVGWRLGFFSTYPNILRTTEIA